MFGDLQFWIQQRLNSLIQYGKTTRSTENGADGVQAPIGSEQRFLRRMWAWGIRSVPPVGSESVSVAVGGSSANRVMLAAETTKLTANGLELVHGPTDLKEGETALYDASGSILRMSQDGTIKVDSASPGGTKADIILNGGSKTVAIEGGEADSGSLSVAMATVAGVPVVAQVLYWEPGSVVAQVIATFPAKTAMKAILGPGAPNVKA